MSPLKKRAKASLFQPTIAQSPFDRTQLADVIILSSDKVNFYLLKGILIFASPFFESMFSLAQPATESPKSELPTVPVSEDSATLDALMRLCYPVEDPELGDIGLLEKVLEAALKYQLKEATHIASRSLRNFIEQTPREVYAIACRLRLEEEAALSAGTWRSKTSSAGLHQTHQTFSSTYAGGSYVTPMATISSACYYRLLHHLYKGDTTSFTSPAPSQSSEKVNDDRDTPTQNARPDPIIPPDILLRSKDDVLVPVHSSVLHLASAQALIAPKRTNTFVEDGTMKSTGEVCSPAAGGVEGQREISVELGSAALRALVDFCYPLSPFRAESFSEIRMVLDGAMRYDMHDVIAAAKVRMMHLVEREPLSIYFFSAVKGWKKEAEEASRHAVAQGVTDVYAKEMEEVPASTYYALLDFQHRYTTAVQTIVGRHAPNSSTWQSISTSHYKTLPLTISIPLVEMVIHQYNTVASTVGRSGGSRYCYNCGRNYSGAQCSCQVQQSSYTASDLLSRSEKLDTELKDELNKLFVELPHVTP